MLRAQLPLLPQASNKGIAVQYFHCSCNINISKLLVLIRDVLALQSDAENKCYLY